MRDRGRRLAAGEEHDTARNVSGARMPVLFVRHGSPTNAFEENGFSRAWADAAKSIPRPSAVLCVSADRVTPGSISMRLAQIG
jgi:4,5-DOPA dioxygenase extradiol